MSLITPEAVAAVMELRQVPHTLAELEALVRDGLPKSALRAGVEHATQGADARRALLARIIPEATYKRRRDRLTPDESEKTERLARIVHCRTSFRPRIIARPGVRGAGRDRRFERPEPVRRNIPSGCDVE